MPPVIIGAALAAAGAAAGTGIALATGLTVVAAGATMASTIAAAAIMGAAAGALGGAAQMFSAPKPFKQEARDRNLTVRQPVNPKQRIYGTMRTGGPIVFLHTTGDAGGVNKNKWLHMVIVLASHEVQEIGDIYFNEELVPIGADGFVESGTYYYSGDRGGHWQPQWERGMAYIKKYTGAAGQVADPVLVASSGGKWTSSHVGNNTAYIYVRLEWNDEVYKSGIPNITAVVKGAKVTDPRDGLVKWSDNPVLCLRDYMMLPVAKGGLGVTTAELDATSWIAGANVCDEVVLGEKRYTCNGTVVMSAANAPKSTIEAMLSSMSGTLVYAGGKFRVLPAVFRTPVFTLTERDVRESITFRTRTGRRDNFNAVKGQHTSPLKDWQLTDYPPVISTTAAAEDGGETIFRDVDFPFTTSSATAQRLAKIALLRTRQPIVIDVPCQLTAMKVQAGDVIYVTMSRYGWTSKAFEVVGWTFAIAEDGALGVDLSLKESHPSIYDFNTSENQLVDPAPGTTLPNWTDVSPPANVTVDSSASQVIAGADGSLISRVIVSWDPAPDGFVTSYEVQWRISGTTDWPYTIPTTGFKVAIDNVPVGASVDIRVRAFNALGTPSVFVQVTGHVVIGTSTRANPAVTGLKVQGSAAGSPGTWNTLDVTVVWSATDIGALFRYYVVEVRDGASATGALRRTVRTRDPFFFYGLSDNRVDGLNRTITFVVRVETVLGGLSDPAVLFASNPAPGLPTAVSLSGDFETLSLRFTPPTDPDWTGTLVWRSTSTNFVRNNASLIYDGPDTSIFMRAEPGTTYYVRYASYDAFGKVGLTESAETVVSTVRISHADLATEVIDSSNLVAELNTEIAKIPVLGTAITDEATARQNADSALSTQINSVTAAASIGFNPAESWQFGVNVEGWTAVNGSLAWQTSGAIRQTATTTDPQLSSPAITVNGAQNRYIKARVTRVAGSGWDGTVFYQTGTRSGRSTSFRNVLPNPNLVAGASTILVWDMHSLTAGGTDWQTSTIQRIWIDLGSTTADVFDIDFVGIGADAPAAGTALVQSVQTSLVNQIGTVATDLNTVQTTVGDHTASIQTQATSINGLSAQYTVKVQSGNLVSGFGLASEPVNGTPTSSFVVVADRFAIAAPAVAGFGNQIPFIIKTIGSLGAQLSFTGSARFDKLESGTLTAQALYIGSTNVVLDGPSSSIRISQGATELVRLGLLSGSTYGIEIKNSSGQVILSSGAGLAAGTVGSSQLTTGRGVNLVYNGDFQFSLDGWTVMDNTTGQTLSVGRNLNATNTITGVGLAYISAPGTPANGAVMVLAAWGQTGGRFPVVPGRRYEANALLGQYRSAGAQLLISFYDSAGNWISNTASNNVTNTTQFVRLNQLGQALVFATAPANAVSAMPRLIVTCNGGNNPFGMITQCYFGEAGASQTEASPWVPGPSQLSAGGISGLGSLATQNSVTTAQVSGLGGLATQSSVPVQLVSGLGSFATASQINAQNASTYIAAAALGSAHINDLSASKLTAGVMRSDTWLQAGNNVFLDSQSGGRFYILDPRFPGQNRLRVYAGHNANVDYGFWLWDINGTEIFGSSGLTGTFIKDLTVNGSTKLADLTVNGQKIQDLAASNSVGGTAANLIQYGVGMDVLGNRSITVIANIRFSMSGFTAESGNTAAQYRSDSVNFHIVSNGVSLTGYVPAGTVYGSNWTGTASIQHTFTPGGGPHARNFFVVCSRVVQSLSVWAIENRK